MDNTRKTMQDYIASCPDYIRHNTVASALLTKPVTKEFLRGNYRTIWIIGCGSSMNGAMCARPFIRKYLGTEVKVLAPFTFVTCEHDITDEDMVILVSQSGYSLNVLEAAEVVKQKGRRCIALTGDLQSDLANVCDIAADYGAGRETVGFVTRGMTTLTLFLILFAIEAGQAVGTITAEEAAVLKEQIIACADVNEQVQKDWVPFFDANYRSLSGITNAYVCGVGANYGTALEGALKISETVKIMTAAHEPEEFIHGPNLQLTPGYTVFLIETEPGRDRIRKIYEGTRIVTDNAYLITTDPAYTGDHVFHVSCDVPDELTPLCILPFFQLTAWKLAADLNRWEKHPLQRKMEEYVYSKSENYSRSPFNEDTPGHH